METEVIHLDSIQTFFLFIQNQILGMKWLNSLIKNLLTALNVDVDGRLGGSIQFFIYDVLKITILLCFLIFIISYIQSYFPPERSKKILGRFHGVGSYIISALLGTVTPFIHPTLYRIHKCRFTVGRDFLVSYFLTNGGFGQPCTADEHIWRKNCNCLCHSRPDDSSGRRRSD